MIKIEKLNKYFQTKSEKIDIFSDFSFEVFAWEFVSIIWPSWSWKSTFLNLISWINREYKGIIKINNLDIKTLSDDKITEFRWKNISYIFQNFKLIENLTVWENIDLVVELNNLKRNFDTKEILKIVWLESKIDTYAFNLSWWESQRVAIARAFVWETWLLLADEPTWALDLKNKEIIIDLIQKLHKKTKNTILMITHDDDVAKIADKIYKLSNFKMQLIK